jgi:hypothetical protein
MVQKYLRLGADTHTYIAEGVAQDTRLHAFEGRSVFKCRLDRNIEVVERALTCKIETIRFRIDVNDNVWGVENWSYDNKMNEGIMFEI